MSRKLQRPPDALARIVTDRWSAPFWQAAQESWLTCAQCAACGHFRMPPTSHCPKCLSKELQWPRLPGTGTIYSYTIVERAVLPGTEDNVPYVVAVVALDGAGDARLISNIVDGAVEDVAIGARVQVVFDALPDGVAMPRFVVIGDADERAGA